MIAYSKFEVNPNLDDVWKALPGTRGGSWSPPSISTVYGPIFKIPFSGESLWKSSFFYSIGDLLSFTVWPLDVAEVTKVSRDNIFKWKIKFCNSWATYMLYTSKECIFHVEFKFRQKKWGLLQKNLEKDDFFRFLIKNYATPVGFDGKFFTTGGKNFKNNFFRTC